MDIAKKLALFGLSSQEAHVYLACVVLGPSSVQEIAEHARLHRVAAYGIIEKLLKRGFVRTEIVGKKRKIAAYPPMKLWDVVNEQQEKVKKQMRELETLVPELKRIAAKARDETSVTIYEGFEGMKSYSSEVLTCKGEILEWTKIENYTALFDEYLNEVYFPRKKELQTPTRFLFVDTPGARKFLREHYLDDPESSPMKARFIDPKLFDIEGYVVIYDDNYSINIPSALKAIVIHDPVVADTQRKMFEFAWQYATDEVQNKPYPL